MGTKTTTKRPAPFLRRIQRGNPRLQEEIHDPYRSVLKSRAPATCGDCGATYRNGRWRRERVRTASARVTCPACRRIKDRYPAGEILLAGAFLAAHRDEILQLVRNVERAEYSEHPLHRIMDIRRQGDGVAITTTDIHLPRRIGHALENAWRGELETHYDEAGHFARVRWTRED